MPRNRDRNAKYKLDIYVIISEISDEFIVWKIKSGNTYTAYKDHARLKSSYTKNLFLRSIEQMKMPKMYLLETVICSQREAMKHCIVWTKYFKERGKTPVAGELMKEYTDTLDEESLSLIHIFYKRDGLKLEVCGPVRLNGDGATTEDLKRAEVQPQFLGFAAQGRHEFIKSCLSVRFSFPSAVSTS